MGLYDAATDGRGSTAELAELLDLPIVLIVDAARQAQSVAALVRGFRDHGPARICGVILNQIGNPRHAQMIEEALGEIVMPVIDALPRVPELVLPERHLGLVQAGEYADLTAFLDKAADTVEANVDLDALAAIACPLRRVSSDTPPTRLAPLGQHIAIARDEAFPFAYPHILQGWRNRGAEISFFSPLADEGPGPDCDAVYLPGGYPELHAGTLAHANRFRSDLRAAAARKALVYGEYGGYMVLGETRCDAEGTVHRMAGLLPLETSFRSPRLHLGYRRLTPRGPLPWAQELTAHEFHYASTERADQTRLSSRRSMPREPNAGPWG